MRLRQSGFTLTELLVVIAIIAILSGMLFPVMTRARASARQAICMTNMKNIAAAITMYVADWDGFWPAETNAEAVSFFDHAPGGGQRRAYPQACERSYQANPYLRVPVILDEYVRNRDVWRCPEAHILNGASVIIQPPASGRWLDVWAQHRESGGRVS